MSDTKRASRVLVVDDDEDVRRLVVLLLRDAGYAVECAGDGAEALTKIRQNSPELVILDLMMPSMPGWDVLASLRRTLQPPPVVVLSALGECRRATQAGAAGCLAKPFRIHDLLHTCEAALGVEPQVLAEERSSAQAQGVRS